MKISTEIDSASQHIGEERSIEYIAEAGFDAWDFSMFGMCTWDQKTGIVLPGDSPLGRSDYLSFARKLKQIGVDCGIHCNQSHAPFPSTLKRDWLKRAIECTAEAGGNICVIHPDNDKTAEENAEMYLELLPFAKEHGVKIATENMWNWDPKKAEACFAACGTAKSFREHIDAVNDEMFVACLDIGHAEMRGMNTSAVEMIYALGEKLQALHIHDNDKHYDSHQIPFSMQIDFKSIVCALKEIKYEGYFTLEADSYLRDCSKEMILSRLKELAESARKLANMYESS